MAVEVGGIGARLRTGREKLGLTVLQAAEKLHVDARILESLEGEDFDALGAPVFARGHLRHYAELVGESAAQLAEIYSSSTRAGQPDLTRIAKAPAEPGTRRLVAPAVGVLLIFAVAGGALWLSSMSAKNKSNADVNVVAPTVDSAGVPASSSTAAAGVGAVPTTPAQPGSAVREPTFAARPGQPSSAASATGAAGDSGAAAGGSASATPAVSAAGAADTTAARAHSKHEAKVTLHFSADSWTEVYDASGARLYYDVGAAKSVQTLTGTPPLRLVLGNAAGVSVNFNGRNTPIDKLSQPDGSAQISINRAGRAARARPGDGG